MSSSEKVRVELTSSADTSGIDKMADASKKLTGGNKSAAEAAYDAGEKTKGMARGLGEGAAAGNAAVSAMAQLSTASKGGAEGMMAIARAGFAAGVSLKAVMASMGPFGIAAAAIGIAMGVVSLAFRAAEKDAEEVKKKIEELNKLNLEAIKTQLDSITTAAKEGADALTEEAAVADRFADAKLARDKLQLEVDAKASGMSEEEKSKRMLKLERDREDQRINQTKETKERIAKIEEDAATQLAQKQLDADEKLNQARSARPEYEQLKKRERELMQRAGTFDPEIEKAAAEELQNTRARLKYLEKKLPEIEARIPGLEGEKEKADSASTDQAKAAKKARDAADVYAAEQGKLKPVRDQGRDLEDKKQYLQTEAGKAAAKKANDEADARLAKMDRRVVENQVAVGMYTDGAAYSRVYGEDSWAKLRKPAAVQQPNTGQPAQNVAKFGDLQQTEPGNWLKTQEQMAPTGLPKGIFAAGSKLPGDGEADGAKIKIDAKPLDKGLKENATKLKSEIDKQLAQISAGVAANSVALTSTAAAAAPLATAQTQMRATIEQMQSQLANLRP